MKKALAYSQKYMYSTVDRKPRLFLNFLLLAGTNSLKFAEVPTL